MLVIYAYLFFIVPVLFLMAVCITCFTIIVKDAREHVRGTCRILFALALAHIAGALMAFPSPDIFSGNTFGKLWLIGLVCTPLLFLISALLPSTKKE
jgi:hypothetical protein